MKRVISFFIFFFWMQNSQAKEINLELAVEKKLVEVFRQEIKKNIVGSDEQIKVQISNLQIRPNIEIKEWTSLNVFGVGVTHQKLEGIFSLPLQVVTKDGKFIAANVFGMAEITSPVYVSSGEVLGHEVLQESHIKMEQMPWKALAPGYRLVSKNEIIGRRVRVRVSPGTVLWSQILDEPLAVKAGETVALTLVSGPGVLIRSRAVSKSNGKIGDRIKVLNPQTKKTMDVLITAEKEVELTL